MISYLSGKIIDLDLTSLIILTSGGVGYEVLIHENISFDLSVDTHQDLYIYDHITENSRTLFGFIQKSDRQVFIELIKISGVGGKVAMQILSLGADKLMQAVAHEDNKMIESIKGIGKKMAEKIILELRDKDLGIDIAAYDNSVKQHLSGDVTSSIKTTLINMGYAPQNIDIALENVPSEMTEVSEVLQYVIKQLS